MNQNPGSPLKAQTVAQSRVTARRKLASLRVSIQRRRLQISSDGSFLGSRKRMGAALRPKLT